MPNNTPPQDHRVEAERWLQAADREGSEEEFDAAQSFAAVAQVHASLAIAEQLERLNGSEQSVRKEVSDGVRDNAAERAEGLEAERDTYLAGLQRIEQTDWTQPPADMPDEMARAAIQAAKQKGAGKGDG